MKKSKREKLVKVFSYAVIIMIIVSMIAALFLR